MLTKAALRGYLLEEILAWLLRGSGYRLLVHRTQDPDELIMRNNGLCVKGRGADHQVDVLGEFAFTPAFSLPIRLFLEAKFAQRRVDLSLVRNAHGVVHDINENFVHGSGNGLRKRYRYVYALFSTSGFTEVAQGFALAHQILLVDLSGASFTWLRHSIELAADGLFLFQDRYRVRRFPVGWMRSRLRQLLETMPGRLFDEEDQGTEALGFARAAAPVPNDLVHTPRQRQRNELLLGFPAAPFILPMAADDVEHFVGYARQRPDHVIRLRRTGEGNEAEWNVSPAGQEWTDQLSGEAAVES